MPSDFPIQVGIVGTGLIGGSIAKAVALAFPVADILLFDQDADHATWLESQVAGSRVISELASLSDAEFVFVSTPVSAIPGLVRQLDALLSDRSIVIDCGSAKAAIITAVRESGPPISNYVPGHPMGGATPSGPVGASADIIRGHPFLLCKAAETAPAALERAARMLASMGAVPFQVGPDAHDRALALTSHLPHLAAYALTACVLGNSPGRMIPDDHLIAGSFRTISQYVVGEGIVWADIFLANAPDLLRGLDAFGEGLEELRALIESRDRDGLVGRLESLAEARRAIVDTPS